MSDLNLPCAPLQYGISNDPEYAGVDCFVSHATRKELWKESSSEFLLLKTDGPSVVWRGNDISLVDIAETDKRGHEYYQKDNPLIYRDGSKIYVVAVSKGPELKVYVVPLPG
jgi:catabolite regulation protein CreA